LTLLFTISGSDFSSNSSDYISIFDFGVFFIYLIPVLLLFSIIKRKNEENVLAYKYFITGFTMKILFGIIFSFIYLFYYQGGDSISYFWSSRALSRLLLEKPANAIDIIFFDHRTFENWLSFDAYTSLPLGRYFFSQGDSFSVVRFSTFFMLAGFNLWLPCLLLLNIFWYRGIWKFFLLVCKFYPGNIKWNAISILFIPSVLFWGSGIMKDSYTFSAALWLVTNIYYCFIERKKFMNNFLMLIVNSFILISLKPYIFVAIIPASLFWASYLYIKKIKNSALRFLATPGLLSIGILAGIFVLRLFSSSLGSFGDMDSMLKKAQVYQQDQTRAEEYGQNFYDIGKFDASLSGIIIKTPAALVAGIYRPFIWEARNPVMLISGLENFLLLLFSLFMIFRIGIKAVYIIIIKEPFILFSFIFSLIFFFSVGLASANFGALVRYRIIAIPFFLVALANTYYLIRKSKQEEQQQQ